tara:strand:- start:46 stop:540 length:495 start_codon:yes stop_codon:yes gene_type:complete
MTINIKYLKRVGNNIPIRDGRKKITIETPLLVTPFGIEENGKRLNILVNIDTNSDDVGLKEFSQFILDLDEKNKLEGQKRLTGFNYSGPIRKNGKYIDLKLKIPQKYNRHCIEIYNNKGDEIPSTYIKPKSKIILEIEMGHIWIMENDNRYGSFWNVNKIILLE